ncbi:MAG TPA: L,D-transpeptidase [Ilumatobacter sp.]
MHGSSSVPNYPASHGCVRVTPQAMDFIWDAGLMPMSIPVWVHT